MWVAVAIAGAGLIGAGASMYGASQQADAANNAANLQAGSAANSNNLQLSMFNQQQHNMQPWLEAGTGALNRLSTGLTPGGEFGHTPTFDPNSVNLAADPGYQFRLQQGNDAITAAGAAAGNLGSGNLGVALQNYGQAAASQEYGQAYSRAMDLYNSKLLAQNTDFNRLSGVAGTGQVAVTQLGNAGANMAGNIGNNLMTSANNQGNLHLQGAQANANGVTGVANSLMGGIGAYQQYGLYQNYLQGQSGWEGAGANQMSGAGNGLYTYNDPSMVGPFLP